MNRANLEQIFGRYVKRFPELNTGGHDEVYKWEIAAQFRPMIDRALAADDTSFPKRLVDVVQLTEQTIDNRYELSFYALSDYAKSEPTAVRQALRDLLEPDGGDLQVRNHRFTEFLNFCQTMHEKYYRDRWRYQAGIRLPMMITGFYDPEHYYLYKALQAKRFADCVEFYDNWGSGTQMDLQVYHRMCDELVKAIRDCPALLETNRGRADYARGPIHPDEALHLLAFDIIYCCSVYGLFDGIHYTMRNGQERKAYLAKIDAARAAAEERAKAEEQVARLEHAEEFFEERLSAGSPIAHRSFGVGRVIGRPGKYLIEVEFPEKSRSVTLVWRDCIKSGIISLKTGVDKGEYDELSALLSRADRIRQEAAAAEEKLAAYAEYL